MKNIKVLIITTVKIGFDGLTSHILSYIGGMNKDNIDIDLVSARGIDDEIMDKLNSVGFNNIYRLEFRDKHPIKYYFKLKKLIKNNKYDIVHAHGNSSTLAFDMMAAKHARCKVRIAHSHNTMCDHGVANKLLKPFFRRSYNVAFACGTEAGKWMFDDRKFSIIPNGKEIDKFIFDESTRKRMRRDLKLLDDEVAIGNVAAFVEKKNHAFLIDSFKAAYSKNNKLRLFLFGIDGDSLEKTLNIIKELHLQDVIKYMGTKNNISEYLNAMDLMALPSLYEGFPISIVEWQINGLPCIISDTITRDCDVLKTAKFLPINEGFECWAAEFNEPKERYFGDTKRIFADAGFDIETNSKKLKLKYFDLVK